MAVKTGQTKNGTLGKPGAGIGISVDWYVLVNHYNLHFIDLYILLVQYSPYLKAYSNTLGTVAFEKIETSTDPASLLLKRIWNVSTGQEA